VRELELLGHARRKISLVIVLVAHALNLPLQGACRLPKETSRRYRHCVRHVLPPVALALAFVNCVNHGDSAGLAALMSANHLLQVFDETPVTGRDANVRAWAGYFDAFPAYVIYPHRIVENEGGVVAILGHTTGSHLGLTDDEEEQQTLIWLAATSRGAISGWTLVEDTPLNRDRYGLGRQQN
jgi:SnoaL-like domain